MVLSGPNLGRLGSREPEIYGSETLDDIATAVTREGDSLGLTVDFRQSNDEAELIGWIHEAVDTGSDVILNPAAFTHYSYAIRDACAMVTTGVGSSSRCTCPTLPPASRSGTPPSWRGWLQAPLPDSVRSPTLGAAGTGGHGSTTVTSCSRCWRMRPDDLLGTFLRAVREGRPVHPGRRGGPEAPRT